MCCCLVLQEAQTADQGFVLCTMKQLKRNDEDQQLRKEIVWDWTKTWTYFKNIRKEECVLVLTTSSVVVENKWICNP